MKLIKLGLIALVTTSAFYSCKKTDEISTLSSAKTEATSDSSSLINQSAILQQINDIRQKGCNCGATPMPAVSSLTWNLQLEAAAKAHAEDMSKNNYFSHTGLDGSNPGTRITAAGYSWQGYGENIAKGYITAQAVVDAWLQSEGHCKNMMNADFKEVAVSLVNGYWVQEFGIK